ncbi:hypothetical protein D3C85_1297710 [compost metagenome]
MRVDPHRARFDTWYQVHGLGQVVGPQACGQTVLVVVGQFDDLVFIGERHHRQHRAEYFVTGHAHAVVDIGQYGRLHEEPIAFEQLTTGHHAGAFFTSGFDVLEHADLLLARHQGVDRCGCVHAGADRHGGNRLGQAFDKFVIARLVHIEARCCSANLAIVEQATEQGTLDGLVDVGVL